MTKATFVQQLTKLIAGTIRSVEKSHGQILPDSVAKRVASQLFANTTAQAFGDDATWVKYVRGFLGLTQSELAAKLNTTQVTVSRWENGVSAPSRILRKKLEQMALNI